MNITLPDESTTLYFIEVENNKGEKGYIALDEKSEIVIHEAITGSTLFFEKWDKARYFINLNMKNIRASVITNHQYLEKIDLSKYERVDSVNLYLVSQNSQNYIHYSQTENHYRLAVNTIGACVFTEEQANDIILGFANDRNVTLTKELLPKKIEYKLKEQT